MQIYKKLFRYVPQEKVFGYLSIVISGISAFLLVYGYYYIYLFLKELVVNSNLDSASYNSLRIVFYLTLSALLYLLSGLVSHKLAFRLETNLRKRGIDGLTDASFRFFDLNSSGYIRKTIDDNAANTHTAVAHMLPDNSQAFLVPIFTLILSFTINIRVGIVIIILSITSGLILKGMMGNGEFMKLYQDSLDKLSSETVEYIRGMQVVKIFGTKLNSFKALHEAIINYSKYAYNYSLSCKRPYVVYQLIFLGLIAIISIPLSFFLNDISNPKVLAVELIMIFFLSGVMMVSFMKIMWASQNIFTANYAVDNLEALYEKMQEDKLTYGNRERFENSNIEFDNVSFSYGDKKVLENLSFSLEEKKTYALVGHSGSGKSTIAKLLSGFYKVDSGAIKIGGHPLGEYTKEAIIKNISFVFQDSKLFKKSIYENVALADETASRQEVMQALKLAECNDIIEKFNNKENTIIGSKGVYLSGGEKQRIAIARAILKKSPIVIMDEASASIDADNEYELQRAFKNLMKDKTVIMIAHRMTSIKNVDEILVLENGKVIERGNDEYLMKKQGLYNKLLSLYETANDWRISNEELL
ncbi:ABC transporter ATP-binding protein [Criibacterium bergeronii]|uniref:ABC transporter ATP-binding protein n=1 Tax=Criibacterium bergeronii TaxID=1871336 RepID=A0A371IJF7_9FIRM|nr:ABC transporter ATP-binding protein [Criibacterium bergeronii]MBS6063825.1 ABC transporter ATP-binding protein [Peptostreptococcaceae bacterium]RDY20611.1 ABC transporter ATP-binding protein [Criibacterium bergeronii]TRW24023.1 ABC transporter ATP-binding protein [Criibacterium bergeronii]